MKTKKIFKIFAITLILISSFSSFAQTVFTVTKTTDPDPFIYSTNPDDSNIVGTLQWAIRKANDDANQCIINFNIPGSGQQVIGLNYELPQLTNNNVVIDATSQTDYSYGNPMIKIDGQENLGTCFRSYHSKMTIKGVYITNFNYHGISGDYASNSFIQNCIVNNIKNPESGTWSIGIRFTNSVNCTIQGNIIGTVNDNNNLGIENAGIFLWLNCNNALIGGSNPQESNTIANCGSRGIWIASASTENKISRNLIYNNPEAIVNNGGGNNQKIPPVINGYVDNVVSGTSAPNDIIEIFGSTGGENANEYLISTTANVSGNWSISIPDHSFSYLVTTGTDESNNTSELSNAFMAEIATTQLIASDCGIQDISFDKIHSSELVTNALEYEFRIVEPSTGANSTLIKSTNTITLLESGLDLNYNTDYEISVKVNIDGTWGDYGEVCKNTTIQMSMIKLLDEYNGRTVGLNQILYGMAVIGIMKK